PCIPWPPAHTPGSLVHHDEFTAAQASSDSSGFKLSRPSVPTSSSSQCTVHVTCSANDQKPHTPGHLPSQVSRPGLQEAKSLLQELMSPRHRSLVGPFTSQPRDQKYISNVQQPMWLELVQKKMDQGHYKSIGEVICDLRLLLENCYRFHGLDHWLSRRAQRFESLLEEKLALLPRCREVSRREADEEKERVAAQWDESVCLRACPTSLAMRWELPAIGHFLCLAQQELGLPEVAYYELERCLLLPRASRFLAHLFTSLLLAPRDRGRCPPMPYKVWERRLRCRVRSWWDEVGSVPRPAIAADKLGLDSKFFLVLGERSPLEEKSFHDLPFLQRLWLLKGLCDHIYASEAAVQAAVLSWPIHECREVVLGYDSCSCSYLHFPQFCGADLRVYRQEPLGPPSYPGPPVLVQQFSCHTNVSISRHAQLKRRGLSHSRCRARARSKMRRNRRYSGFAGIHHGSSPSSSSLPTLLRTSLPSSTCSTPPKTLSVGGHSLGNNLVPVSFARTATGSGFHLIVAPTVSSDHLSNSATMLLMPASLPSENTDAGNEFPKFVKGKVTGEEPLIDPQPSSQLLQTLCFGDSHSIRVMTRTGNTGVVKVKSPFSCPLPTPLRAPTCLISAQKSLCPEVARSSVPFLPEHAASLALASVPAVSVPLTSHITFPLGPYAGVPPASHIVLPPVPLSVLQTTQESSMPPYATAGGVASGTPMGSKPPATSIFNMSSAPVEGIPSAAPVGAVPPAPSGCSIPQTASGGSVLPTVTVGGVLPTAAIGSVPLAASVGGVPRAASVGAGAPAASVGAVSPAASLGTVAPVACVSSVPPAASAGAVAPAASVGAVPPAASVCSVPPASSVGRVPPAASVGHVPPAASVSNVLPAASVGNVSSPVDGDDPPAAIVGVPRASPVCIPPATAVVVHPAALLVVSQIPPLVTLQSPFLITNQAPPCIDTSPHPPVATSSHHCTASSAHPPVAYSVHPRQPLVSSLAFLPIATSTCSPIASIHPPLASSTRPPVSSSARPPLALPAYPSLAFPAYPPLALSARPPLAFSARPPLNFSARSPLNFSARPSLAFPNHSPIASLASPMNTASVSPFVCSLALPLVSSPASSSVSPLAFSSVCPKVSPSIFPQRSPSFHPLVSSSIGAVTSPILLPLASSSVRPLASPSVRPLASPSVCPLASPSVRPLASPSVRPPASPSVRPPAFPLVRPPASPSVYPPASPSVCPLASPSVRPLASPSVRPLASSSVRPPASPSVRSPASPLVRPPASPSVRPLASSSVLPLAFSSVCSQTTTSGHSFIMPSYHPLATSSTRLLTAHLSHPLAAPSAPLATSSTHLVAASSAVPAVATSFSSVVATPTHPLIEISAPPVVDTTSTLSGSLVVPKYCGLQEGQAMITSLNLPPWLVKSHCTGPPRPLNSSYRLLVPCSIPNNRNSVVPINSHGSITLSSFQPSISKSQGLYITTTLLTTKPSGTKSTVLPIIGSQVAITIAKVHNSVSKSLGSSNSGTFNSATDFPVSLFLGSSTTSAPCALAISTVKPKHLASSIVLAAPPQPVAHLPSLNIHSSLPPTHAIPSPSPSFTYSYSPTTHSSFVVSPASFPPSHHLSFSKETQLVYSQNAPTLATSHSSSFCQSFPSSSCTSFLTPAQYVSDASFSSVSPSTPCSSFSSYSRFPSMSCLTSTVYCLASAAPCLTTTSLLSTKSFPSTPSTLPFNLSCFSCASIPLTSFSFKSTPISSPSATKILSSTSISTPSLSSVDPLFSVSVSFTPTSISLPSASLSLPSTFVCFPSVLTLPNFISTSVNYPPNSLPSASFSIPPACLSLPSATSSLPSTSFSVPSASVSLTSTSISHPSTSLSLPPICISLPPTTISVSPASVSLLTTPVSLSSSLANVTTPLSSSVILQFVPAVSLSQCSTTSCHQSYFALNPQSPLHPTLPNGVPLEIASQNIVQPISTCVLQSSERRPPNYCSSPFLSSQASAARTLQNLPGSETHKPHTPLAYLNSQYRGGLLVSPEGAILSSPVTASNLPVTVVSPLSIHFNQGTVSSSALIEMSGSSSQSMAQLVSSVGYVISRNEGK
uniref:Bromo domain-containing protein n=1 Tax=Eptatretus burgeri TaxID=7764 RepID=A0A8C4NBW3_EPTBU